MSKNPTILVVDDEADIREILRFELAEAGFTVKTASCGNEAFEIVCNESIDLVVSDIRMPEGDGIELLEKIRAHDPKEPIVVFLSGYSDLEPNKAIDKGASAILAKPIEEKELVGLIKKLLKID